MASPPSRLVRREDPPLTAAKAEIKTMRIGLTSTYVLIATLAAAFLPWALKPLAIVLAYGSLLQGRSAKALLTSIIRARIVLLTLFSMGALLLSAIINASPITNVLQSAIPLLIIPYFAAVADLPKRTQEQVLSALVLAAFLYCVRYTIFLDWTQLLNSEYRGDEDVDVFVALNAALLFCYAANKLAFGHHSTAMRALLYGMAVYGLLAVLIIKSRGTLAAIALTVVYFYFRRFTLNGKSATRTFAFTAAAVAAAIIALPFLNLSTFGANISDFLHLADDGTRSFSSGSGRFPVWEYSITHYWPEKFWLGHGPRANLDLIFSDFNIHGAHNVIIASLVDGGLLATIPIVAILALPLFTFRQNLNCVFGYPYYAISLVAALNENLLFSFGSPYSWVSLIMFAQLTQSRKEGQKC